ncbi:hypothetical protein pneo_cds_644 [Pandoravirus neocaledonia]|uniref:Uncharacterized protein n=1 Tax=Pandoravirus neocaledonia TaxID=2107708 RepID=A0A2U7UCR5_9VIRU|nr:hypothetical protein pneo_cds_644 [Pandoravirus neocaledonia]AVK76251.1 hypothetical protein pneo_cds_644 [Pandoravirus neocaledonia]
MNAPNPAPASGAAPAVCASYLKSIYPSVDAMQAVAIAVSVSVEHLIKCIKATYREGIARDARPRRIAFTLHHASGLTWMDYACLLDQTSAQPAADAQVGDALAARADTAAAGVAPHGTNKQTTSHPAGVENSCAGQEPDVARDKRLIRAAVGIVDYLASISIVASLARLPDALDINNPQGHLVPICPDASDSDDVERTDARQIVSQLLLCTMMQGRDHDIVIYVDVKRDQLWCHLVPVSLAPTFRLTTKRMCPQSLQRPRRRRHRRTRRRRPPRCRPSPRARRHRRPSRLWQCTRTCRPRRPPRHS